MADKKEQRYVSENAQLMAEWDWEKNDKWGFNPNEITSHSGKKVWWICVNGHSFDATVANRSNGKGCPYCSGHKVMPGINDLATLYPSIVKEWNTAKNGDLLPTMVSVGSGKKVWWKCRKGHEWQAIINSRTIQRTGCPICRLEQQTSFPEQAILFYCSQVTPSESRNMDFGKEIDIYLPKYRIGIEYNGIFWHKDKNDADRRKVDFFADKNIRIITIAESNQNNVGGDTIEYVYSSSNKDSLNWAIQTLFGLIGLSKVSIDVINDASKIYEQYITIEKENSLASKYPEIANQWNYEKNLSLKPEMIMPSSNKKIWWKCSEGHEWQATIANRNSGNGCPYCSGRLAVKGKNDLQILNPDLANEWDFEKNGDLKPKDFTANSGIKVWWKCSKGHEWQARITDRNKGQSCPYCSGKKVLKGYNDLQTTNPTLAEEWNYEKNTGLTPWDVSPGSNIKVWWKCKKGHEWQATINNRNKGRGCPYCTGKKVLKGFNDLQTVNPALANQWNYKKNNGLTPADVMPNSNMKIWWKCNKGHEWQSRIADRNRGKACPYCAGQKVIKGVNDLQTVNPTLVNEWNYEKNKGLTPVEVMPSSNEKVWWKCNYGHEWEAAISNRNKGSGCPHCARKERKLT